MRDRTWPWLALLLAVVVWFFHESLFQGHSLVPADLLHQIVLPFAAHFAGDAQVHRAVAESFVNGRPFQSNLGDSLVMASTSPFWTMLLVVLFHFFGNLTPLALKAVSVLCWAGATYLLWKVITEVWQWPSWRRTILLAVWLSNIAIIVNALDFFSTAATTTPTMCLT